MSRRIEIELTSARPDGTWTWRAAGAREPKGVLTSDILPGDPKVGDVLRAEVDVELEGTTVLNTSPIKDKSAKTGLLEILPSSRPFEEVTQQLAKRDRSDRGDRDDRRDRPPRGPGGDRPRGDGDRRPRRDGDRHGSPGGPGDTGSDGGERRPRRDGDRPVRAGGDAGVAGTGAGAGAERRDRRPRPNFAAPPELPQRPKPKRLKPGRTHRNAVLADLPEAQRAVAERALQGGIPAVRQAVIEQNTRLKSEGKEEIPAAGLIQMAEQLLPKLRVAEWLDRATAAKADLAELALPDLRSVVAAGEDPVVVRDETTRHLAAELKLALAAKQESDTLLWLDDITAALGVGRVIRALKLSSQPPKAGVPFPHELATRLAAAATAALTPDAMPDRWSALLEAAAFAPVRSHVKPAAPPSASSDELAATVKRLAPALPHIAALFGIEVIAGASMPKPMRPTRPVAPARRSAATTDGVPTGPTPRPQKAATPRPATPKAAAPKAAVDSRTDETTAVDPPAADAPTADTPTVDPPTADTPTGDTPHDDTTAVDTATEDATPTDDTTAVDTATEDTAAADATTADTPSADTQTVDTTSADATTADAPTGDTTAADATTIDTTESSTARSPIALLDDDQRPVGAAVATENSGAAEAITDATAAVEIAEPGVAAGHDDNHNVPVQSNQESAKSREDDAEREETLNAGHDLGDAVVEASEDK